MYVPATDAFSRAVALLKLPRTTAVAVGLSGGSDSVALTYLAKQAFNRVIAITVDHKLREESTREAERVGEIARSLGAEHLTVALDWDGVRGGRTETNARYRRYGVLLEECARLGVDVMMVGHHSNDQIETMISRMTKGSGIIGLGGMYLRSRWASHPKISIVRPLLKCSKTSLVELCRQRGLEWVEDPTNLQPITPRNEIRDILSRHPELEAGLVDTMSLIREARTLTEPWIRKAMSKVAFVDRVHGTVSFSASSYRALNPYVARSALAIWLRYTSASGAAVSRQALDRMHNAVMREHTSSLGGSNYCTLIPLPKAGRFMIAKAGPQAKVPISVGETIYWDNRFKIRLFEKRSQEGQAKSVSSSESTPRVFYVRNFHKKYDWYLSKGLRKIKQSILVHPHARSGLPIIMDEEGKVVLIPHFRVINHAEGVDCEVQFSPRWSMEQLVNFSYVAADTLTPGT